VNEGRGSFLPRPSGAVPVVPVVAFLGSGEIVYYGKPPEGCVVTSYRDIGRAFAFIDKIEAGMIHVNRPGLGGFSHMPFGGFKYSSYGAREVGDDTVNFYTDIKSVYIQET